MPRARGGIEYKYRREAALQVALTGRAIDEGFVAEFAAKARRPSPQFCGATARPWAVQARRSSGD